MIKIIFWLLVLVLIIRLVGGDADKAKTSESSPSAISSPAPKDECSPKGYFCKSDLVNKCGAYKNARSECAAVSNVSKCIDIKMGLVDAEMARSTYCDSEGNPNLWLLKP